MSKKIKAIKKTVKIKSKKIKTIKRKITKTKNKVTVQIKPTDKVTVTITPETKRDTIVSLLLDESGSMSSHLVETINGFNSYIKSLREKAGSVDFTLTKFEGHNIKVVHNNTPIKDVAELTNYTFIPGGSTPLFDAIGKTIRDTETVLKSRKDNPFILFVIMTDGQENASHEFNKQAITSLISQKKAEGWDFVYLSANIDAYADAKNINISLGNTIHYTKANSAGVFMGLADVTTSYSTANLSGITRSVKQRESLIPISARNVMESGAEDIQSTASDKTTLSSTK